jgi:hypothetical protein
VETTIWNDMSSLKGINDIAAGDRTPVVIGIEKLLTELRLALPTNNRCQNPFSGIRHALQSWAFRWHEALGKLLSPQFSGVAAPYRLAIGSKPFQNEIAPSPACNQCKPKNPIGRSWLVAYLTHNSDWHIVAPAFYESPIRELLVA